MHLLTSVLNERSHHTSCCLDVSTMVGGAATAGSICGLVSTPMERNHKIPAKQQEQRGQESKTRNRKQEQRQCKIIFFWVFKFSRHRTQRKEMQQRKESKTRNQQRKNNGNAKSFFSGFSNFLVPKRKESKDRKGNGDPYKTAAMRSQCTERQYQ